MKYELVFTDWQQAFNRMAMMRTDWGNADEVIREMKEYLLLYSIQRRKPSEEDFELLTDPIRL